MIRTAEDVQNGSELRADVCIVGGGAAGIALALALQESRLSVLLLESGATKPEPLTQALYAGEVVDERLHSPPHRYRERRLGGSTTIWGGRCVPLDDIDFERRDFLAHSGWPIGPQDLAAYYPQANELAEAGRFQYDAREFMDVARAPLIPGFASDIIRTEGVERFSCPTDFGQRYRRRLERAFRLDLVTGANCTAIRLRPDGQQVDRLEFASLSGKKFHVVAAAHVLAVGGLETPRLLLASHDIMPTGVGNAHDVVGRYYMCHIAGNVGALALEGPPQRIRHGYEISPDGVYCRRRFAVAAAEQRRHGLTNMVARLHFPRIADPRHRSGVLSGMYLVRRFIRHEYGARLNDGAGSGLPTQSRHLRNVLTDPIDTAAFLLHWLRRRTFAQRKFPSVILRNRTNRFSLEINAEQAPNAASRVQLGKGSDALGMPPLRIDWRYSAIDIDSVGRSLDLLASEVRRCGVGTFEYDRSRLEEDLVRFGAYGGHHIGTARMGSDPADSVVNSDCRMHDVGNLYVAGSAVFPTSSQANPTLTILALALRLGEHLTARLSPGQAVP